MQKPIGFGSLVCKELMHGVLDDIFVGSRVMGGCIIQVDGAEEEASRRSQGLAESTKALEAHLADLSNKVFSTTGQQSPSGLKVS